VKAPTMQPEKMPERHDHGKNFIGIVQIELFAKSFILRLYDVLARHSDLVGGKSDFCRCDMACFN
jgi:hypothetical protein